MKIEKYTGSVKQDVNLTSLLKDVKKGEALRLTTARQGYVMPSAKTAVERKLGFKFRSKVDGDDVLVIIVK